MATTEQAGHTREPTPEQHKQERAIGFVVWLDVLIIPPYLAVGLAVGSLAIIAEVLRGGLLLLVVVVSLRALRRSHRGLVADYDYGIGKLERALSGGVAVLLLCAAGFIVWRAFVLKPQAPPSSFLAALAIGLVFVNLGVNSFPLIPLWRSLRGQPSLMVLSLFRAGLAKALGSVVVVTTVCIHGLASNPMAGRIAEAVGALVVVGFMIVVAVGLLREALPDLLDRAIAEPMQMQVTRTLATFYHDYDELIAVRTRRSGNIAHVEITLGFAPEKSLGDLSEIVARMREHLQQAIPNSDIVIVPRAALSVARMKNQRPG
jgi:divalent metal cation (Fe/Co/Zn/Cd) transporter